MKMVDQQRQRVEQEMTKMIDELDRVYLRRMQGDMHRCSAKCCDNPNYSLEQVQQCVERCSSSVSQAQNYVQKEMEHTQQRLQRCIMDCNDSVRDQMGATPSDSDVDRYTTIFEKCATKCVDNHVAIIPNLLKTMKTVLAKIPTKDS